MRSSSLPSRSLLAGISKIGNNHFISNPFPLNQSARLNFIYSIFDYDGDQYIERDEMLKIFMSIFEAMNRVHFQAPDLELLKTKVPNFPLTCTSTGVLLTK